MNLPKYIFLIFCGILFSCDQAKTPSINDLEKRNSDWVWFVDNESGNGEWLKVGGKTENSKEGRITFFYDNGEIYQIVKVQNGDYVDTTFNYLSTGVLFSMKILGNDTTRTEFLIDGEYTTHYQSLKIKEEGLIENGFLEGEIVGYYESGQKKWAENYTDGFDDGSFKTWYEDGIIKSDLFYSMNLRHGTQRWHYENGVPHVESNYSWGNRSGPYKKHYESGQLNYVIPYKNGKRHGRSFLYSEKGEVVEEIEYEEGEEINRIKKSI
jgi:antitoxin component YwqK of YwqJK toxin-antitoxin module